MDPNATLREMIDAAKEGDKERYDDFADYLFIWLNNGGYEPYTSNPAERNA